MKQLTLGYLFCLLYFFGFCFRANAFPEMVRHGYASCTACHVSPDGGGVLSAYGRSMSREVLSTWGGEGQEGLLHGAVKPPDWLQVGGDFRGIQTYYNSSARQRARFLLMQADVEAAATVERWTAALSIGHQDMSSVNAYGEALFSRRHFVMFRPSEALSFRLGRFYLPYGIALSDHFVAIKRGLRWDEGSESYNLETSWLGENADLFVTLSAGRPDAPPLNRDKGIAIRGSRFLSERYKVGGSYFYGASPLGERHVFGPYAILGFSPDWFVLAELDFQRFLPGTGTARWGIVNYLRLDHEVKKGLHVYLTQDFSRLDLNDPKTESLSFGLGVQFFPIPHTEVQAVFAKQNINALGPGFADFAWLMLHYYL